MEIQKSRTTLGPRLIGAVCCLSLVLGMASCGSPRQSVAGRDQASSLTVVEIADVQQLDNGDVTLAPPSHPAAFTTEIKSRIEANPTVNALLGQGYKAQVEYGDYTSNNYGSPIDGLDPEKAAAMKPSDSERQELAASANKIHPRFNNMAVWFVSFEDVPPTAIPEFIHPGVTSGSAPTTVISAHEASPDAVGTVAIVFSDDAESQLQILTFPTGVTAGR